MDGNAPTSARTVLDEETKLDVAWLAGIFDGEGCISLPPNGRGDGYGLRIEIFNTCKQLLDKVTRTLAAIGVENFSYMELKPKAFSQFSKKTVYRVVMTRRKEIVVVLQFMSPHLTEKRRSCDAAIELFGKRERGSAWTKDEISAALQIRNSKTV